MDTEDIFKKLSAGAVFRKRKRPPIPPKVKVENETISSSQDVSQSCKKEEKKPKLNSGVPQKSKLIENEQVM